MVEVIDYRVSRIVVLCKDCGQDVGLYPARHKCGIPTSGGLSPISKESSSSNNSKSNSNSNSKNNSEGYNLWNKFMTSATAIYYADDDSDNESEKDDLDGETHISRVLREYYENKGGNLPDWLYDSDSKYNLDSTNNSASKTERTSTKRQVLPNRNENKNPSPLLEVDNNRGRQNRSRLYNNSTRDVLLVQNHTSAKMNRGRDKSAPPPNSFERNGIRNDKYHENVYPSSLPKSIDSRITDDQINNKISTYNSLPPTPRRQPPPFPTTPDDYRAAKRLISSKSHNQLNSNYNNNAFNKVGPSRDIKDIRAGSGYNIQKGNGRQGFGTPLPSSRVPNRNRIQDNYF